MLFRLNIELKKGKMWESRVFEVNVESLGCQRVFLDEQKEIYVICQTQQIDGKKHIVIRSPMEIVNNLQIPLVVKLFNLNDAATVDSAEADRQQKMLENTSELNLKLIKKMDEMQVSAQSSTIIPLRNCAFRQIQILPLMPAAEDGNDLEEDIKAFETSEQAHMSLLMDEAEIFD